MAKFITAKMLRELDACESQVLVFEREFGDNPVELTVDNVAKAYDLGLDLEWFVAHVQGGLPDEIWLGAYEERQRVREAGFEAAVEKAKEQWRARDKVLRAKRDQEMSGYERRDEFVSTVLAKLGEGIKLEDSVARIVGVTLDEVSTAMAHVRFLFNEAVRDIRKDFGMRSAENMRFYDSATKPYKRTMAINEVMAIEPYIDYLDA